MDLGIDLGFVHYNEQKKAKITKLNSNENSPAPIQTINELVTALSEGERTKYTHIVQSLDLHKSDLEEFCSWSQDSYTRNCIADNEDYELILLCWEKGQVTPIHDHGGEECWVKMIDGHMRETIYKKSVDGELNVVKSSETKPGDMAYMIDFMGFHQLENLSDGRAMSLHLYAKPIRKCNVYNSTIKEFESKDLIYDTVSSLLTN